MDQVKNVLKLNEQEIELISSLEQKRGEYSEVFLINNDKRGVLRVCPTPLEYWIATTHPADLERIEEWKRENMGNNMWECLKEMGWK